MIDGDSFPSHLKQVEEERLVAQASWQEYQRLQAEAHELRRIFEEDYSGISPAELFGTTAANDCADFIEIMRVVGFPKAQVIGNAATIPGPVPRRSFLDIIAGARPKAPAQIPTGPKWKAYCIAEAIDLSDASKDTYHTDGTPDPRGKEIYLCQDGNIRTHSGHRINPDHYRIRIGEALVDKRMPVESGSGSYMYDAVQGHFEEVSIREKLTRIAQHAAVPGK